jgi:hypothetical protein
VNAATVIASGAKQFSNHARILDCFVAAYHAIENAQEFASLCTRVPYIFRPFCPSRRGPVWPDPSC